MDLFQLKQEEKKLKAKLMELDRNKENIMIRETTRSLKAAKAGNEDGRLDQLSEKWILACQQALTELQGRNPDTSIGQILTHFGIEPKLVNYSEEIDGFM
eukprot:TRINITY_DN14626_c0_g1_i1.p1 TRINITY_DN14626_c0_g1~~TRINITY_DN14626_c0_g1_i1.p1  ORF type:complete len:100 (+),score=35.67 TRINITY_DN14626_c0_g1_i1:14-313(+)